MNILNCMGCPIIKVEVQQDNSQLDKYSLHKEGRNLSNNLVHDKQLDFTVNKYALTDLRIAYF